MPKAAPALVAACLLALSGGCGGSDQPRAMSGPDENDSRATALACLRDDERLDARPVGKDVIEVGDPATGPRIRFFLTTGEAEAKQFEGGAEGSEQIGSALLFVRKAPEGELEKVEACLGRR